MERTFYVKGFALEDFLDVRSLDNAKDFQDANFNRARRWYAKSFRCVSWKSHGQEFHKAFSFLQIDCLLAPSKLIEQRVMSFDCFTTISYTYVVNWHRLRLLRIIRIIFVVNWIITHIIICFININLCEDETIE